MESSPSWLLLDSPFLLHSHRGGTRRGSRLVAAGGTEGDDQRSLTSPPEESVGSRRWFARPAGE